VPGSGYGVTEPSSSTFEESEEVEVVDGRRRWLVALVVVLCGCVTAADAAAQGVPPTQPGPGIPVPSPSSGTPGSYPTPLPPKQAGPSLLVLGGPVSPFDFHFRDQLAGSFFQPDEDVTVTVDHAAVSPLRVTADSFGSFVVAVEYSWFFCGAGAGTQPAPVFHARGAAGSTADLVRPAPPCPDLESMQQQPPVPTPGPGTRGTAVVGTAVAGTAIAVTAQPVTPGASVPPSTPRPWPTPQPFLLPFDAWGFGFVSGEHVTIQEHDSPGGLAPPAVQGTADDLGRLHVVLQASVARCTALPTLVAQGDRGTTVTAPLNWRDLIMAPCPAAPGEPGPGPDRTESVPTPVPATTKATVPQAYTLRRAAVPGYVLGVAGKGWGTHARLRFDLRVRRGTGWTRSSVRLRATVRGSFLVGVRGTQSCGIQVTVTDAAGHRAGLARQHAPCAGNTAAPTLVLQVLQGTRLR
jgi:hypothetical protein